MIKTIDVLTIQNTQYGVLHHFTRKLFEALQRAGFTCRLLEGNDMLNVCCASPPDLTIGFNGVVYDQFRHPLCDLIKRPHLSILVDPPYRFLEFSESPFIILACEDAFECVFLQQLGFDRTFFLPHAVEPDFPVSDDDRPYEVVFLGTSLDSMGRMQLWKSIFPADVYEAMQETVALVFADPSTPFLSSFFTIWTEHARRSHATQLKGGDFQRIFCEIELVIKGKEKLDLLSSIHNAEVHIFGNNFDKSVSWKSLLANKKNFVIHPSVTYSEAMDILRQARIVLNASIKNAFGAHERIFTGMAAGAVILTCENAFLRKYYTDAKEILFYHPDKLAEIDDRIRLLLKDESARKIMAENGKLKTLAHHTWDQRVRTLIGEIQALQIIPREI